MNCMRSIFYVHDEANLNDLELRGQVANMLFIFLPKLIEVLMAKCLGDEKLDDGLRTVVVFHIYDSRIINTIQYFLRFYL